MDFSEVWQNCHDDLSAFVDDSPISSVQQLYFAQPGGPGEKTMQAMWYLDSSARYKPRHAVSHSSAPSLPKRAFDLLASLAQDGYARVDDWGLNMDEVTAEYYGKMQSLSRHNAVNSVPVKLQSIEPLLINRTLNQIIASYLGVRNMSAVLEGYVALRLEKHLQLRDYVSGYWHHDRCGRRLKVFIFIHDIDKHRGRPTVVAKGSQNTFHFSYERFDYTRFNQSWVSENYEPAVLHGKRGGGFILDTNALHHGLAEGKFSRDTIVLEYHGYSKVPILKAAGHHGPCPSKVFVDRREFTF
jgi:hypothetical protein